MNFFSENAELPADFSGEVRLFPLPNLVLFPQTILPLHIFEPRYCELLEESLNSDRLIAMALLQPGWEPNYEARPAIHPMVCVGKIITHVRLPENRHNILLRGICRARVLQELPVNAAFRRARVGVLQEIYEPGAAEERGERLRRMIDLFRNFLPRSEQWEQQLDQLLSHSVDLGVLTDLIAYSAQFPFEMKQQLLAETNVDTRSRTIILWLEQALRHPESLRSAGNQDFPPLFSEN